MRSGLYRNTIVLAAAALLWGGNPSASPAAVYPTLERGLVEQAPALIQHFKANAYHNVGVLKFRIKREGSSTFSDNVGTLNMLLAHRLEAALVLANDLKSPIGVIRNASAVAARTPGADHRTDAGRTRLFAADYPLAWGKREVKADAFVTGAGVIARDLQSMTISLFVFDRSKPGLRQRGKDFTVRIDAGKLGEMNESFVVRGLVDEGQVIQKAARVKQEQVKHPLQTDALPVRLEVLYNGKVVKPEFRDGKAFIPEPAEGQTVALRLRRDNGPERYGVVLKVNGENTIGRQRQPDLYCRRWILDPGDKPLTITGYQRDDNTAEQFRVLSRTESKAREMNYGAEVGSISLTVYRERRKEEGLNPTETAAARNTRIVARVKLPGKKDSYRQLKAAMLADANEEEMRGLVAEGEQIASTARSVKFQADPTPLMSVAVLYYRP